MHRMHLAKFGRVIPENCTGTDAQTVSLIATRCSSIGSEVKIGYNKWI